MEPIQFSVTQVPLVKSGAVYILRNDLRVEPFALGIIDDIPPIPLGCYKLVVCSTKEHGESHGSWYAKKLHPLGKFHTKGLRLSTVGGRAFVYLFDGCAYLEDVFVDEEYRGKGLGEKIVQKAEELAQENGAARMILTSRHGREKLHAWYERLGYVRQGNTYRKNA